VEVVVRVLVRTLILAGLAVLAVAVVPAAAQAQTFHPQSCVDVVYFSPSIGCTG
jgi:hypothetical protein